MNICPMNTEFSSTLSGVIEASSTPLKSSNTKLVYYSIYSTLLHLYDSDHLFGRENFSYDDIRCNVLTSLL